MTSQVLATAIILGYMVLMGIYLRRYKHHKASDYYLMGREMPAWMTPFVVLASVLSAGAVVGFSGIYYGKGFGNLARHPTGTIYWIDKLYNCIYNRNLCNYIFKLYIFRF